MYMYFCMYMYRCTYVYVCTIIIYTISKFKPVNYIITSAGQYNRTPPDLTRLDPWVDRTHCFLCQDDSNYYTCMLCLSWNNIITVLIIIITIINIKIVIIVIVIIIVLVFIKVNNKNNIFNFYYYFYCFYY